MVGDGDDDNDKGYLACNIEGQLSIDLLNGNTSGLFNT